MGLDFFVQNNRIITPLKKPGDAFEDAAFKQGFGIFKSKTTFYSCSSSLLREI
jgi:hypothetical protein